MELCHDRFTTLMMKTRAVQIVNNDMTGLSIIMIGIYNRGLERVLLAAGAGTGSMIGGPVC
jgi:hypothetical protein